MKILTLMLYVDQFIKPKPNPNSLYSLTAILSAPLLFLYLCFMVSKL